jgi:hypothetical protein
MAGPAPDAHTSHVEVYDQRPLERVIAGSPGAAARRALPSDVHWEINWGCVRSHRARRCGRVAQRSERCASDARTACGVEAAAHWALFDDSRNTWDVAHPDMG